MESEHTPLEEEKHLQQIQEISNRTQVSRTLFNLTHNSIVAEP